MVLAPNGNIITSNGGDGNMVETTPAGQQVAVQTADKKTGAGSLFGLVIAPEGKGIYFVDDGENTLNLARGPAGIRGSLGRELRTKSMPSRRTCTGTSEPASQRRSSAQIQHVVLCAKAAKARDVTSRSSGRPRDSESVPAQH